MADFELNVRVNGIEQTVSTIGGLEQALAATNQQLSQVEQNSKEFNFLQNQASNLQTVMSALTGDAEKFSTNLGEVNRAAGQLNNTITETATAASELGQNDGTKNLNKSITETVSKSQSLRTELRKITIELQNLEPGTQRFQELSLRAGELRDQIGDTQAVVSALAGSTAERLGRALASTIQIGIAGFQGITAAASLFGVEAEALEPTLVKLTALLNLSQALETFGALPDKINEITAGFSSLASATETASAAAATNATATTAEATATTAAEVASVGAASANAANATANQADAAASLADAAAKGAETVATEAATVATTALGLAMKALPIVAIVAAVATLTFGIYQYVTANDEAKKKEEERNKQLERAKAIEAERARIIKENSQAFAKENNEYIKQIGLLKTSEPGSKERLRLIKEINSTYGTTFKNLKDENAFLEQINKTTADYIAFQRARFRETQASAKIESEFAKQEEAIAKARQLAAGLSTKNLQYLTKQLREIQAETRSQLDLTPILNLNQKTVVAIENQVQAIRNANTNIEQYTNTIAALEKQINSESNALFKNAQTKDDNKNKTKDLTNSTKELTAAEEFAIEITKQREKASTQALIEAAKRTKTLVDDINVEKQIQIDALNERLKQALKTDEEEVKSKQKTKSEKEKIEADYQAYLAEINKNFEVQTKTQTELERTERLKLITDLIEQQRILQEEIVFGNESTVDTLAALQQRQTQLIIDAYEQQLSSGKLSQKDFIHLEEEKNELVKGLIIARGEEELAIAKANNIKQFEDYKKTLEGRTDLKFTEIKTVEDIQAELAKIESMNTSNLTEEEKQNLEIRRLAYQNLLSTKENLNLEFAVTEQEINAKTNDAIEKQTLDSAKRTFDSRLDLLDQYFSIATQALNQFSVQSLSGWNNSISTALTVTQELFRLSEEKFTSTADKVAAYASVVGSAINSVITGFIDQNQAALDQDLENFRINSDEKKSVLADQYNAGLISRQSYDDGIRKIDKKLREDELKARRDAFEKDKSLRIAQATIAGLQGAVSAFAGAMQLGPIAGPIVGALLAAAVATLTGVQIAQIKKQKFDAGATPIDTSIPSTSSAATTIAQSSSGGFTSFNENVTGTPQGQTTGTTMGGQTTSTRVYVLESDISEAQNRVRVLENNSSFG